MWAKTVLLRNKKKFIRNQPTLIHTILSMTETPRRRITVTPSFNEISTEQLWNRVVVGGGGEEGGVTPHLHPFPQQACEQIFEDDVNGLFPPPRKFASWTFKNKPVFKEGRGVEATPPLIATPCFPSDSCPDLRTSILYSFFAVFTSWYLSHVITRVPRSRLHLLMLP